MVPVKKQPPRLQPHLGETESGAVSFQSQETSERLADLEDPSEVHGPAKTESVGRLLIIRLDFQAPAHHQFQETPPGDQVPLA